MKRFNFKVSFSVDSTNLGAAAKKLGGVLGRDRKDIKVMVEPNIVEEGFGTRTLAMDQRSALAKDSTWMEFRTSNDEKGKAETRRVASAGAAHIAKKIRKEAERMAKKAEMPEAEAVYRVMLFVKYAAENDADAAMLPDVARELREQQ